jgi:DNA repair photolyase
MKGRASTDNPPNRFETRSYEPLEVEFQDEERPPVPTQFFRDTSRTILARNDSPDVPFTFSINPYRGCEHGCIYCYARPSHEYLGFSAGLDFESKIMVKTEAPALLDKELRSRKWIPQVIAFSGNTDCYQPLERRLELTRKCLEVCLRLRNPVGIITKNALVLRDLDILRPMASLNLVHVYLSITTLKPELARVMEPRTSSPSNRLDALAELSAAGVPAGVMIAPVIPGLTDEEMPAILKAASEHGATAAGYILLRLPGAVRQLFLDWLPGNLPEQAGKVINRIRETRDGELSDSRFGNRMTGEGPVSRNIHDLFTLSRARHGLDTVWKPLATNLFTGGEPGQMKLF